MPDSNKEENKEESGGAKKIDEDNMDVNKALEMHRSQRNQLMALESKMRFSYDLEASLTNDERLATLKLLCMRDKIFLEGIHNLAIQDFHLHR